MEDITLTQLFARMDDHLAQQDAYLREAQATNRKIDEHLARQDLYLATITQTLREQGSVLATAAQLLATTTQMVEAAMRDSQAAWAAEREVRAEVLKSLVALRQRLEDTR